MLISNVLLPSIFIIFCTLGVCLTLTSSVPCPRNFNSGDRHEDPINGNYVTERIESDNGHKLLYDNPADNSTPPNDTSFSLKIQNSTKVLYGSPVGSVLQLEGRSEGHYPPNVLLNAPLKQTSKTEYENLTVNRTEIEPSPPQIKERIIPSNLSSISDFFNSTLFEIFLLKNLEKNTEPYYGLSPNQESNDETVYYHLPPQNEESARGYAQNTASSPDRGYEFYQTYTNLISQTNEKNSSVSDQIESFLKDQNETRFFGSEFDSENSGEFSSVENGTNLFEKVRPDSLTHDDENNSTEGSSLESPSIRSKSEQAIANHLQNVEVSKIDQSSSIGTVKADLSGKDSSSNYLRTKSYDQGNKTNENSYKFEEILQDNEPYENETESSIASAVTEINATDEFNPRNSSSGGPVVTEDEIYKKVEEVDDGKGDNETFPIFDSSWISTEQFASSNFSTTEVLPATWDKSNSISPSYSATPFEFESSSSMNNSNRSSSPESVDQSNIQAFPTNIARSAFVSSEDITVVRTSSDSSERSEPSIRKMNPFVRITTEGKIFWNLCFKRRPIDNSIIGPRREEDPGPKEKGFIEETGESRKVFWYLCPNKNPPVELAEIIEPPNNLTNISLPSNLSSTFVPEDSLATTVAVDMENQTITESDIEETTQPFEDTADDSQFPVYWNVPTFQCHSHGFNFSRVSAWGLRQNYQDRFRGEELAILYDPGEFPALLPAPDGTRVSRNGGVPQEGSLTRHLALFQAHLDKLIPNINFTGLAIIDFEHWRPIWRQNWGSLSPYRDFSRNIERKRHPFWFSNMIEMEATYRYELGARVFLLDTLRAGKRLRPLAKWGYYGYPLCFNYTPHNNKATCSYETQIDNDSLFWLFSEITAFYPSLYLKSNDMYPTKRQRFIKGRLEEALRIAQDVPLYPYVWYKYHDTNEFLSKEDMINVLKMPMDAGSKGVVIWGASRDVNSKEKCSKLAGYLEEVIGPAVKDLQVSYRTKNDRQSQKRDFLLDETEEDGLDVIEKLETYDIRDFEV